MTAVLRFGSRYLKALLSVSYAFTFGIYKARNRNFIYRTCQDFGWKINQTEPILKQIPADSILSGSSNIRLDEPVFESGNTTLLELTLICALVARKKCTRIFEIGTFDGRTSLHMALNSLENCRIVTLDLPATELSTTVYEVESHERGFIEKKESGQRFKNADISKKIEQVFGDSAKFDYTPYLGRMDLIFVDASHHYDYVINDTLVARKLLAPGGVVLWHDYANTDWPGVTRALNEFSEKDGFYKDLRWIAGTTLVILDTASASEA